MASPHDTCVRRGGLPSHWQAHCGGPARTTRVYGVVAYPHIGRRIGVGQLVRHVCTAWWPIIALAGALWWASPHDTCVRRGGLPSHWQAHWGGPARTTRVYGVVAYPCISRCIVVGQAARHVCTAWWPTLALAGALKWASPHCTCVRRGGLPSHWQAHWVGPARNAGVYGALGEV